MKKRWRQALGGRGRRALLAVLVGHAAACVAPPVPTPAFLTLDGGLAGVLDDDRRVLFFGAGWRFAPVTELELAPALGLLVANDDALYLSADVRRDLWLSERWVLVPGFGVGLFDDGNVLDLGGTLEFRSGLELAYLNAQRFRIGLAFYHLSNGGVASSNPGTEALLLSLSIPIGRPPDVAPRP